MLLYDRELVKFAVAVAVAVAVAHRCVAVAVAVAVFFLSNLPNFFPGNKAIRGPKKRKDGMCACA